MFARKELQKEASVPHSFNPAFATLNVNLNCKVVSFCKTWIWFLCNSCNFLWKFEFGFVWTSPQCFAWLFVVYLFQFCSSQKKRKNSNFQLQQLQEWSIHVTRNELTLMNIFIYKKSYIYNRNMDSEISMLELSK